MIVLIVCAHRITSPRGQYTTTTTLRDMNMLMRFLLMILSKRYNNDFTGLVNSNRNGSGSSQLFKNQIVLYQAVMTTYYFCDGWQRFVLSSCYPFCIASGDGLYLAVAIIVTQLAAMVCTQQLLSLHSQQRWFSQQFLSSLHSQQR